MRMGERTDIAAVLFLPAKFISSMGVAVRLQETILKKKKKKSTNDYWNFNDTKKLSVDLFRV